MTPEEIVEQNRHLLDDGITDGTLEAFFNQCFQDIVDDRDLFPAWTCIDCLHSEYGEKPDACTNCNKERIYEVATFQARGTLTGNVFQSGVLHIFDRFFSELGVASSKKTKFKDSCDFYLPDVAGIEAKGSPTAITAPDGSQIEFSRPGMKRTDTEKKAITNASTFKSDHQDDDVRFYVISNALPDAWHEEHIAIDEVYNAATEQGWKDLAYDLNVDKERASRGKRGRR